MLLHNVGKKTQRETKFPECLARHLCRREVDDFRRPLISNVSTRLNVVVILEIKIKYTRMFTHIINIYI